MSLQTKKVENGLITEQDRIYGIVSTSVSALTAQTALMVQIAPWMYDKAADPASGIDTDDIVAIGAKFQEQLAALGAVMQDWVLIDRLNDVDPQVAAAARAALDAKNVGKPTLEQRYG